MAYEPSVKAFTQLGDGLVHIRKWLDLRLKRGVTVCDVRFHVYTADVKYEHEVTGEHSNEAPTCVYCVGSRRW